MVQHLVLLGVGGIPKTLEICIEPGGTPGRDPVAAMVLGVSSETTQVLQHRKFKHGFIKSSSGYVLGPYYDGDMSTIRVIFGTDPVSHHYSDLDRLPTHGVRKVSVWVKP